MSVRTATYAGRRAARRTFTDTCRVTRPVRVDSDAGDADAPVLDEDTGQYTDVDGDPQDTPPQVIYEGPFRIQVRADINANAYEAVVGEYENTIRTANVEFPVKTPVEAIGSTASILSDDVLLVLRCPLDPALEGHIVNLQADIKAKSQATKRRFRSRELIG
jgi:hypothetical protein